MRTGISIDVSPADRVGLDAIVADRNSPQKHVWRARIVLLTADGAGTAEIMRTAGVSKTAVWRWQERFMQEGVDGLLKDKTRPSRIAPLGPEIAERVVALTLGEPPGETTHWTAEAMAKLAGVSVSSVQRIWRSHGLQPHRMRQFKLSKDPQFAAKVRNIVGLYVDPPAHAIVLSVDEKSQIQALDRTQPGLPMKKGRAGTMTHDYKRHGVTTLFAALNVLDGSVIGRCMQRHRHQEFIRFLNQVEAKVPTGKIIHAIVDNYATHKHPKVRAWLARHPRWTFHFTPTSASWLNAVEGFFAKLTKRRLKRGVFRSIVDLQAAINRFLAETNGDPRPFTWTADPDKIIAAVRRGHQVLDSIHSHVRHFKLQARLFFARSSSCSAWPLLDTAGGTIIKTTIDHALMRGLATAGPVMRRGASSV
jgi:transposase